MLEAMLVQVFRADVGRVVVGRDVVYRNASLRHQLSDVKEAQSDVLRPGTEGAVSSACSVAVLSQYSGTCANSLPNPSSVSMFEQNTASFIAKADATSSASMVDMAVRLCRFDLKLTGAFASIIR